MKTKEKAIRDAAAALLDAITRGKEAGIVVSWPSKPEGLATISISETKNAAEASAPQTPAPGNIS